MLTTPGVSSISPTLSIHAKQIPTQAGPDERPPRCRSDRYAAAASYALGVYLQYICTVVSMRAMREGSEGDARAPQVPTRETARGESGKREELVHEKSTLAAH